MKKNEVPQDKSSLSSINMKELCYATDENGNYTTELSEGWRIFGKIKRSVRGGNSRSQQAHESDQRILR